MIRLVSFCPVCGVVLRFAAADCCSPKCRDINSERLIARQMNQMLGPAARKSVQRRNRQRNRRIEAAT